MFSAEYCKRAIAWLMFSENDTIRVEWADVARQRGGNDCGLFTIAIATELCFGDNPELVCFNQWLMRKHFLECVRTQRMTKFPKRAKRKRWRDEVIREIELVCTCRQPASWDASVICIQCGSRFHPECVNFQTDEYICC